MSPRSPGFRRARNALLGCAVMVLGACADATTGLEDPLRQAVVALGFRSDMIVDRGDHFLVEGDIHISKASLRRSISEPGPMSPFFQWRTTNLVSSSAITNIVVNLTGLEGTWQTAMRDAMAEWNSITPGAMMKFYEGSPGNITATMTSNLPFLNCSNGAIAKAEFPDGGQPGPTIQVSSQFTSCLTASQKKYNMAHELGHTIGFRHTNWQGSETAGSVGAILIPGTPETDPASVMNGGTGLSSWSGFSYYDQSAAFRLYPRAQWIISTTTYPGGTPLLSWSPLPDSPEYSVVMHEYGWQSYEGEPYGYDYVAFGPSPWTTATELSMPGFSYTGTSTCGSGTGQQDGDYYRVYYVWIGVRYPGGFGEVLDLIPAPDVMVC